HYDFDFSKFHVLEQYCCVSVQGWIASVRGGSFSSQGKHITSSCSLVAFNTDQAGGMVGLTSVNPASDGKWTVTQISCHADLVTDLDFSPFDDYLLATCSADETVSHDKPVIVCVCVWSPLVLFHPAASELLAVASVRGLQVWDVTRDTALTGKHTPVCARFSVVFSYFILTDLSLLLSVSHCLTDLSTRGTALVPKLALDVSCCEVLRLLQLTDNFIVPISYQVPRKDFHADLYPDTVGHTPAMTAEDWWKGENKQVLSSQRARRSVGGTRGEQFTLQNSPLSTPSSSAAPSRSPSSTSGLSSGFLPSPSPSQSSRAIQNMLGPSSKFRHIQGAVLHRDTHITNLRGLHLTTPGECDGFCANGQRVAVPLAIAGGQIAVFELSQPGKLPDTALPTIQNSVNVADFCWDPFDTHKLVVAGDDAKIRVWQIPKGGLTETLTEPECVLRGHTEKIYSIKFHPHASGLLASSSYDLTVRLWNLGTGEEVKRLSGHQDQIFGIAWSPDGKLLATVCKDGKVRLYDPRKSTLPIQEGPGPEGHRGARVVWVCDGKYLLVSGFDSRSERQLYLFSAESLASGSVASVPADVSPSTLIPFYDPDTSVLILTGKGDTRVYTYEILPEAPYFMECSSFHSSEPHKGLCFLPKTECDVRDVEVARAIRLGKSTIEPVAFRVPRVKKEFFQDDVFPETAVWWEASLTAAAWLSGSNGQHRKISLQPKDMTPVSEAPKEVPVRKYLPSSVYLEEKTDEQKKEELLSAMVAKLGNREDPLPQASCEGVDEDEWVSEELTTHTHTPRMIHDTL
uniref:Coronin n=1 Tax=Cyprinus carpio TaxID=7962 RepID=A0A8C2Q8N9_CYPCA